jgi:glycosyltransferase involved in cell wall biosynthesis
MGKIVHKVIYDLTYAARGKSGIPRDTRSVAEILCQMKNIKIDFVISPKGFNSKRKFSRRQEPFNQSNLVNKLFQDSTNLFSKIVNWNLIQIIFQAISIWPYIILERLTDNNAQVVFNQIKLKNLDSKLNTNISLMGVSYAARFARPKILGRFRIKTKGVDFYIQQQIDPIKVGSNTNHIVRLHDILPITHPFFFTLVAQKAFSEGLSKLLVDQKIIWVMDTDSSKQEFHNIFGFERKVEVIPCEVGANFDLENALKAVKNKNKNKNKNIYINVNTIEPRKNVEMVISAFLKSISKSKNKIQDELIIVGSYGWMQDVLIQRLRSGFYGKNIVFFEDPQDSQLQELYEKADFLISASQAEGFGLPPLEAMFFGCLPIVSNLPQHRETMRDKAVYFELNEQALSDAISNSRKISKVRRAKLGVEAHNYVVKNFSKKSLALKWSQLLDDYSKK